MGGLLTALFLSCLLAVSASAAGVTDFADVDGHWAYDALEWAVESGVMVGTSGGRMDPDGTLTRAQLAAMVTRLFGAYKTAGISSFADVPADSWYHDSIAQAVNMGIFTGYSSTRMGPEDPVTREQAMTVGASMIPAP